MKKRRRRVIESDDDLEEDYVISSKNKKNQVIVKPENMRTLIDIIDDKKSGLVAESELEAKVSF